MNDPKDLKPTTADKPNSPAFHAWDAGWHFDAPSESKLRTSVGIARNRLLVVMGVFAFGFLMVFAKLVDATVMSGVDEPRQMEAAQKAITNGGRADIIDRNGAMLASSLPTVSLYADAARVIEPARTADKLREVFPDLDRKKLIADLSTKKRFVWVKRHLPPQQYAEVNKLGLPGLEFQQESKRIYPQGALFSHTLGYLGVDQEGLAGLEKTMDQRLKSDPAPLQLSLDVRLQHILKRELATQINDFTAVGGAGMIMDARNGEILAMISLPDFDPHEPGTATDDAKFNRATLGVYEMGSTFKIFNTAMALDSGRVKMSDRFDTTHNIRVGRFTITDYHPAKHNYNVPEIMEESSNIGSVHMYAKVGAAWQKDFLTKLGLTKQPKLEIPERGVPMIPNPWSEVSGMTISFGHGIAVSALNLVKAAGAIVNGGILIDPTLIKVKPGETMLGERVIAEQTSVQMRQLLRLVVTNGTAKSADAPGYYVGGKTGTADKLINGRYVKNARMSNFIGAFPINDPRYVVYILVDDPKPNKKSYGYATGGWVAAPAVGRIVAQMAPLLGLAPQPEGLFTPLTPEADKSNTIPADDETVPLKRDDTPAPADEDDGSYISNYQPVHYYTAPVPFIGGEL